MDVNQQKETKEKENLSDTFNIFHLKSEGKKYLDAETAAYQLKQHKSRDSETKWLKTALQQGTTSDKIAASVVLVQDNPKCNLGRLASLISQVRGAKHNQYRMLITSLKELFLNNLLDPKRKLLKFEEQEFAKLSTESASDSTSKSKAERNQLLVQWYFEDQLREQYERFILNLSAVASDTVETNREIAISAMTDLLIGNAEQERKLLELIVNKIGDPSHKVGSKAVFCITKLLHEHPNMKFVVLREIEKLLFRKNVSERTKYYAICLLIQFVLDKDDEKIADTLLQIYFAIFKACLKKGEPDSRMMAAILMGVNRAYPFAKADSEILLEHIDSVYKVVHLGTFNVSLNALCLLHQVTMRDESQGNRFYSAFYRKLLDPQIGVATKRATFLNLLYRVLAKDQSILRLYAFIKRILQVAFYFPANMTCATLYVISKILHKHKNLTHMLLTSNIKVDVDKEDVCEIKVEDDSDEINNRLADAEDVYVLERTEPQLKDNIILSNVTIDTEIKSDVKKQTDSEIKIENIKTYDPFCRNPLYAGAANGICIELRVLANHFHPSVALFANLIIQGKPIGYTGDPLEDLTLIRFLDRYVFKNPKKLEDKKVQKRNEPLAQRAGYTPRGIRSLPVDSAAYLNELEERIPVDEVFLHRYFKQKSQIKKHIKKDDDDSDDDADSVNSEEFNDMLDHMSGNKDFDDVDIAADIVPQRKTKAKMAEDFDDDDEDDNSDDEDDTENDDEDDNGSKDFIEDTSASDNDLQDFSDDELVPILSKKIKSSKTKERKTGKGIDNNIFVSAEKFATMLEEQNKSKRKYGSSNIFSDRDGASEKQIDWEMKRLQKVKRSFGNRKRKLVQAKKDVKRFKR
ncbi:CCAAT/enhancer-binding protein zeta [Pseudomyrmex gracilis]|uniref:CCAAT/enhancer-binding protein zeta n=1 Tax=Pseudomyrmex gracilis TaxID=219809 RepID=UPI0009954D6F|nr:CCAAT/enhancer-binding protein zeta [Pseudomyrmex gracilis]